jgi:CubicO group peptidase (beta-lactamase class C family)
MLRADEEGFGMDEHGPRISRSALARMTGATALGLAVAPEVAAARSGGDLHRHLHRSDVLADGRAGDVGMDADALEDAFARVARRATDARFPGAVALVARRGIVVGERAFGVRLAGSSEATTPDTLFDLESMTKVLATATAALLLVQKRKLSLTDPVAKHLPHFATNGKGGVLVRDLLRYSSGLPIDNQKVDTNDIAAIWSFMEETPLEYPTGSMVEYSDLGYRLLGRLIEAVAGKSLDAFAKQEIWGPLGMADTTYNPGPSLVPRCAATGPGSLLLRPGPLRGSVQDDQDWKVGGIVGCDGVFATARNVAIFSQMILNGGCYGDVRLLQGRLVAAMVTNQTPQVTEAATDQDPTTNLLFTPKGYGFELWTHRFSPGGMRLSPGSYGKSGGAGTFMWIDPKRELIAVLLTNHGLPVPFDQPGWNKLIDEVAVAEFCDGVVNAVRE